MIIFRAYEHIYQRMLIDVKMCGLFAIYPHSYDLPGLKHVSLNNEYSFAFL